MHIGHYISGVAHVSVISWALFGVAFHDDPPPFEVSGVSVVTTDEFAALMAADRAPAPATDVTPPVAPALDTATPTIPSQVDKAPALETPDNAIAAEPDAAPDVNNVTPQPSEVSDVAPTLEPPGQEMAVLIPRDTTRPMVRPVDRVAPEPIAAPDPDTKVDDVVKEAATPDESQPENINEPQEATAPEAATDEIVTEAKEQVALAPKASLRPVLRPSSRPATAPKETTSSATDAATDAAVAEAMAEAQTDTRADAGADTQAETQAAPSGPPLSRGEKDAMRVSVQKCWIVDVGGQSADVTVTVGFSLDRDGKVSGPVTLLSSEGGDTKATEAAFQSARRAVRRCGQTGYKLPIDKYDHWRDIEITFNPKEMRRK